MTAAENLNIMISRILNPEHLELPWKKNVLLSVISHIITYLNGDLEIVQDLKYFFFFR